VVIHIVREKATSEQIQEMLETLQGRMIKVVVDVEERILAGGGGMHADCEATLLEDDSRQADLWGANWYPDSGDVEFESLINIRPRHGNRKTTIEDPALQAKVESIVRERLERR
jgi:hypothetical protein